MTGERYELAHLSPKRRLHTLGVVQEAETLARRYGASIEQAHMAALLHDITREWPPEKQLNFFVEHGIMYTGLEASRPAALLHAQTGAALAAQRGLPEPVVSAIRWHTTGRAGMTVLEKILYLADMTEPFRRPFPGLAELRRALYRDLDDAMRLALRCSVTHQLETAQSVHPASVEAWNDLHDI